MHDRIKEVKLIYACCVTFGHTSNVARITNLYYNEINNLINELNKMPFEKFKPTQTHEFQPKIKVSPEDRDKAEAFFEEATKKNPDTALLRRALSALKNSKKFLEALAVVTIDKTNPRGDRRWGMIRKVLKAYDNLKRTNYLGIFNEAARKETLRRGRRG